MIENAKITKWEALEKARSQLQSRIKGAMEQDDKGWFDLCERLRRGDELIEQARQLWLDGPAQLNIQMNPNLGRKPNVAHFPTKDAESAKARGERVRAAWVSSVSSQTGKPLPRIRGALYRNSRGETLGIPYSRENAVRLGHWFLGLPGYKFDCAALLCETTDGQVRAICLSSSFLTKHASSFSTSKAWNQTKFNVIGRGKNMYLLLATGEIDITHFVDQLNNVL
jgi:hypothetical protein